MRKGISMVALVMYPTSVGGNGSTYISDNYYLKAGQVANGALAIGGRFADHVAAGMWYWAVSMDQFVTTFDIGSRFMKYQ